MILENIVDETNTQKEKIKTVMPQINNALKSLNSSQTAKNLAEVPSKIDRALSGYNKISDGKCSVYMNLAEHVGSGNGLKLPINVNAPLKHVIAKGKLNLGDRYDITFDSERGLMVQYGNSRYFVAQIDISGNEAFLYLSRFDKPLYNEEVTCYITRWTAMS